MHGTRAPAPLRGRMPPARHFTTWFALLSLLAIPSCSDVRPPLGIEPSSPEGNAQPSTLAAGARPTYTNNLAAVSNGGDPSKIVRIYKNHDAWRSVSDGGRDERTLVKMGMVKGRDFFVHPMRDLASGIPAGTRAAVITANSPGDVATSATQRSPESQQALLGFLGTGGTVLLDLADNEEADGYVAPGAIGTPAYDLPAKANCADATLAPAAFGADGVAGTADDHRFVRGADGVAGTADDVDNEAIDLANGGLAGVDRTGPSRGCAVVHGNLENGITLPSGATVLATATWPDRARPVLAEYCHAGGLVVVNTLTLGYFGHKPREGAVEPLRSTYIQKSLFAYALSDETRAHPSISPPVDRVVYVEPGLSSARVDVGMATAAVRCNGAVTITATRSDGAPTLDAPYSVGITTIAWTARNAAGNEETAKQTVAVYDESDGEFSDRNRRHECVGQLVGPVRGGFVSIDGDLIVPSGQFCIILGVTVNGNVIVESGAVGFHAHTSTIKGGVLSPGPIAGDIRILDTDVGRSVDVRRTRAGTGGAICRADIGGNITLKENAGNMTVGIGFPWDVCFAGNTVHGHIKAERNTGQMNVNNNRVEQSIFITRNTTVTTVTPVTRNVIGEALVCAENTPVPASSGNTARTFLGECRPEEPDPPPPDDGRPRQDCVGELVGPVRGGRVGPIEGHLVVPSGQFCIILGVVVNGDVLVQPGAVGFHAHTSTIDGSVLSPGPIVYDIRILDTRVGGSVDVRGTRAGTGGAICRAEIGRNIVLTENAGNMTIGIGFPSDVCFAGNTVHGDITADGNTGQMDVNNNRVDGSVFIIRNTTATTVTPVSRNVIAGVLACVDNTPAPASRENKAGRFDGQCSQ